VANSRKTAIVTGAGSGIGAAVATLLARRSWAVIVNYAQNREGADAVASACREAGGEAIVIQGDVARDEDCRRLAALAQERFGRLDALVNNAAVTRFANPADLEALTAEDFQRLYAVNVVGAFQMARAAAPALRASGAGAIVNISSFAGLKGFGSSLAYAASKGALNSLTLGLARVLAPEIRVNALCPSFANTEWLAKGLGQAASAEQMAKVATAAPLKRVAEPEDVADAACWLIEGARHMTGALLTLDGGLHLTTALD
jgi:3-oxoacyl-[acyl-carrier protein] reductase